MEDDHRRLIAFRGETERYFAARLAACYPEYRVQTRSREMARGLQNQDQDMTGASKCPLCGGSLAADREVERVVREGRDVALVMVRADVCQDCGDVLLLPGMAERLVVAKDALRRGMPPDAVVVGRVYDLRAAG